MKVRIEFQDDLSESEVIIRCSHISESIMKLQTMIRDLENNTKSLILTRGETEYFIPQDQILFFETEGKTITAHTADKMYETQYRLYELEEMLPGYFMRVSKSTIVNLNQIYSITRNLTASSVVEFSDSIKKVYVSRNYYKSLIERMGEKRKRL